ncbi:hypothetical protein Tsubulata_008932 [Turnera subulata]|uniref:PB1 domain-containing protein n=1 Tax=Turnera subulata TaxID=218843 RepID=A0A9Q0F1P6_9ROSI|nr:hypothetical protein Tsubulata_008932 [Turnera subulata]
MDQQQQPLPPPPPTAAGIKLRLMCSYGGQIIPRSNTKSLYYAGGDTRIITFPYLANLTTLSSLTAHLAAALHIAAPFSLKYQLPNHDLDSLISLSTDEDLLIMLDEHQQHHHHGGGGHRAAPHRIRLFLFPTTPTKPVTPEFVAQPAQLKHPKTESWFVDALNNAKIMQSEGNGNGSVTTSNGGGAEVESLLLETTSSFGSTCSSLSPSNLPVKGPVEDSNGPGLNDNRVTSGANPDPIAASVAALENKVASTTVEANVGILGVGSALTGVEMLDTFPTSDTFPVPQQFTQPQQQLQFVQPGAQQYVLQTPGMGVSMSPYYLMNAPVHQQQQLYYQTNEPQLIYFVPAGQPYNLPLQSGLFTTTAMAPNRPPLHPNSSTIHTPQVAFKVAATAPVPELASQACNTVPMNVPHHENSGLPPMNMQAQATDLASAETTNFGIESDDDPVRAQIYKSQPPPPMLPSQYQTLSKATTV